MALFSCPECSNKVSDQAATCPHCGFLVPEPTAGSKSRARRRSRSKAAPTMETDIRQYTSRGEFEWHSQIMSQDGWTIHQATASDGHVNIGRTVTGAALTGGLSLLFGGSRSKGTTMIVYQRPVSTREDIARKRQQAEDTKRAHRQEQLATKPAWQQVLLGAWHVVDDLTTAQAAAVNRNQGRR